jgi:aminopeptidase N
MQGPGTIGRSTSHEIGHQWFYGLVGDDQGRDPWLDEGLATYAEGRFEGTLESFRTRAIPAGARGQLGRPMSYWEPNHSLYNVGVYIQGAKALASLGDPNFVDCALRLYVARNAYRIARPPDLLAALAAVFPGARSVMASFGITSPP